MAAAVAITLGAGVASQTSMAGDSGIAFGMIDVTPSEDGLRIEGRAIALQQADLEGDLQIERNGSAGQVTTRQSTSLDLAAGETGRIARVGVSFAPGDMLKITLTLRRNDEVVAQTVLSTGGG